MKTPQDHTILVSPGAGHVWHDRLFWSLWRGTVVQSLQLNKQESSEDRLMCIGNIKRMQSGNIFKYELPSFSQSSVNPNSPYDLLPTPQFCLYQGHGRYIAILGSLSALNQYCRIHSSGFSTKTLYDFVEIPCVNGSYVVFLSIRLLETISSG